MDALLMTADRNVLREETPARRAIEECVPLTRHLVVVVLNPRWEYYPPKKISSGLWIVPTNSWIPWLAFLDAIRIAKRELYFQGRLQTDVISAHDAHNAGLAAGILAERFHRPLHVQLRENVFSPFFSRRSPVRVIQQTIARMLIRRADAVRVFSESVRTSIAGLSTSLGDRTTLSRKFVNVPAIQREPLRIDLKAKYPQCKFLMLAVAPLFDVYQLKTAIIALAGVLREYPHAGLVIVGDGPERAELMAFARHTDVIHRVAFESESDNIISYYKTAQVFLNTAPYEPYADTIEEALASGCATVSTPVGLAPVVIKHGESGYLCDAHKPTEFVKVILDMVRDPIIRERVRLNGMLAIDHYMAAIDPSKRVSEIRDSWQQAIDNYKERA